MIPNWFYLFFTQTLKSLLDRFFNYGEDYLIYTALLNGNMVSSLLSICCFVYTLLFLVHDCDCLFAYVVSSEQVDHHMVLDIMPIVARLLFSGRIPSVRLSQLQLGVLLAVGLQQKTVDAIGETSWYDL